MTSRLTAADRLTIKAQRLERELREARARITELEAAEQRVRALHPWGFIRINYGGTPLMTESGCTRCVTAGPCLTLAALDGPPTDDQDRATDAG